MREITYKGETHTLKEWCKILQTPAPRVDALKPFVEELEFDGRLSNAALYELYVIWQGENCMPKASFEKRIVSAFKQYRPELKPYRSGNVRGWEFSDSNS